MTAATVSPTVVKSTPQASLLSEQAQDVPIFLRKTYHMIDTCDQSVACWSEDGETFVVKDPEKFEKQIIPQFFKHSKFSSFVRQLNFYAFRKIKYADTIRIDPKLEAETANYWRFRHEKFQRGKPELLSEIKRMNGQKQQQKAIKAATPDKAPSAPVAAPVIQENSALKSEVSSLKQRIDAMTKNIDELTSMVQKVTLAQAATPEEDVNENNKRTKVEPAKVVVEPDVASPVAVPSAVMELDSFPLPPSMPSPIRVADRTASASDSLSDEGFVDQLFTAFKTEEVMMDLEESSAMLPDIPSSLDNSNRPRPELMNRLSDALSALPRDIQELIVDRLIQAITSPKDIQEAIQKQTKTPEAIQVAPTKDPKQIANLQLAAATLSALLSQCGGETSSKMKDSHSNKALLIPVHA